MTGIHGWVDGAGGRSEAWGSPAHPGVAVRKSCLPGEQGQKCRTEVSRVDLKSVESALTPPFGSPSLGGVDSQAHLGCFNQALLRKTGYEPRSSNAIPGGFASQSKQLALGPGTTHWPHWGKVKKEMCFPAGCRCLLVRFSVSPAPSVGSTSVETSMSEDAPRILFLCFYSLSSFQCHGTSCESVDCHNQL